MPNPEFAPYSDPAVKVIEECGELIQALCKAQTFGFESRHPDRPETSNLNDVLSEVADVMAAIDQLLGYLTPGY